MKNEKCKNQNGAILFGRVPSEKAHRARPEERRNQNQRQKEVRRKGTAEAGWSVLVLNSSRVNPLTPTLSPTGGEGAL